MEAVKQPAARPQPPRKRQGDPLPAVIHGRGVKVTVVVEPESFPFQMVPAVGTPGGKTVQVPFVIRIAGGKALNVTLKGGTLQRFAQTVQDNPQGGAAVIAGKLADDGTSIIEAGITFQPKAVDGPVTQAAA